MALLAGVDNETRRPDFPAHRQPPYPARALGHLRIEVLLVERAADDRAGGCPVFGFRFGTRPADLLRDDRGGLSGLVALLAAGGVRMVQQYQRGVVLRFGRLLPEVREPGLRLMGPIADRMVKVPVQNHRARRPAAGRNYQGQRDAQRRCRCLFRVIDPVKAVVNVENYLGAISQVARTFLRSVIGRADLDTMLSDPRAGQFRAARGDRHPDR